MIPAASITHVHNHGASGWEIFAWCLAAVMVAELILAARDAVPAWWGRWQDRHAGEPVQDASEDPEYACCSLDPDHPGVCEFTCSECNGSGKCWACLGENGLDDIDVCSECVNGECDVCNGTGREVEPEPFVPTTTTRDEAARAVAEQETT